MNARAPMVPRSLGPEKEKDKSVRIRQATVDDLDLIMEIEHACFPIPWTKSAMEQEIDERAWSHVDVAIASEKVSGFMVYWTVVNEIHLLNFAVHPSKRQMGIGKTMLTDLVNQLDGETYTSIILEVRVSNTVAQRLYRNFGFSPISRRAKYYSDNDEDAIVMCLRRS